LPNLHWDHERERKADWQSALRFMEGMKPLTGQVVWFNVETLAESLLPETRECKCQIANG